MKIKRVSSISGIEREMDIPVTQRQLEDWYDGMLIQNAMPNLNDDEREFLMTGITPEEWEEMFS